MNDLARRGVGIAVTAVGRLRWVTSVVWLGCGLLAAFWSADARADWGGSVAWKSFGANLGASYDAGAVSSLW